MPLLSKFETPARLRDVPRGSPFYNNWSDYIKGLTAAETPGDNGGAFYDPTETDVNVVAEKAMVWMGFPRDVLLPANRDDYPAAYAVADSDVMSRSRQNEYFEWRVDKNAKGKITKVTFVTEFPQYYRELWAVDRSAVVKIYRNLVSPVVQESDLHVGGVYNAFNRWNTVDGIVHYIQSINNLSAAIGLCQDSVRSPAPNRDNFEASPRYANALTSVDPRVSYDVYMLIRKGLYVTLKDPIGVYITDWNNSGITRPNGSPAPPSYWKVKRGNGDMVLRLEYEVPSSESFVVGDMTIGGRPIEYGGQLAEHITVSITGTAGEKVRPTA